MAEGSIICSMYEVIGTGKYSKVFKARRKSTIRYYAVKSVDRSQKLRVLQEVRSNRPVLLVAPLIWLTCSSPELLPSSAGPGPACSGA